MSESARWLSAAAICEILDVPTSTFEKWRARGVGPRMVKLPNGKLRCRQDWFDEWCENLPEADRLSA